MLVASYVGLLGLLSAVMPVFSEPKLNIFQNRTFFKGFVDRASRKMRVMKPASCPIHL
jgi:hypothetical protein